MHTLPRRSFLKYSAAASLGAALPAWSDAVFAPANPADLQVDAEKLAGVVAFIESEIAAGTIPGAGLVATRRGQKFVEHFSGTYRDASGEDTPYHPGVANPLFSFSKGIAATVAMMVKQEGLIDFDVPVSTYIPEYTDGGKDGTTLRHLLTHAAGIPGVTHGAVDTEEAWNAYLAKLCAAEVEWPVGSRTGYHGLSGMLVVAEAIRRVSGMKSWENICRERLFDPLGAESFTFAPPRGSGPVSVLPGYFDSIAPGANGIGAHPAGGAFGTADDMLRVLNMIVQGGTWQGKTLLQPEALTEMLTVQYAESIAKDVAAGKSPTHEPWGIGWLVRGTAPKCDAGPWFGFGDGTSPTLFGHAGVDTIYGVGDPARELAFVFAMTHKLPSAEESTRLRREVSNRLQDAVLV
jgi:CubicO group peptidase (beta-lactamase class C family)